MKRRFNITGLCTPQRHYMVRLDERLEKIKEDLVDYGSYFVINKGRQYGKTTTLRALRDYLKEGTLLFESMAKQLDTYKELRDMIEDIIYRGRRITFSPEQKSINLGIMFGFFKETDGHVTIANRMFEMCLLNLFMAEESRSDVYARGESDRVWIITARTRGIC